jgi:hypothetical protein
VKNEKTHELNLKSSEVTIPWNDVPINPEKFQSEVDQSYVLAPFKTEDIAESSLKAAREKKIEKYEPIIKEARSWLAENQAEIKKKHKVSKINFNCKYIVISNLEIVPKTTKDDIYRIINT